MASMIKNEVQRDQANTISLFGSAQAQTSNSTMISNGSYEVVQSDTSSTSKTGSPTVVVVTHTGELLEDSKDGITSLLSQETKKEILEALQRSGMDDNTITTVVVEDPILENLTLPDNTRPNPNDKLSVSTQQHLSVAEATPSSHLSSPFTSQGHQIQNVPRTKMQNSSGNANFISHASSTSDDLQSKGNLKQEDGNQDTNSDMKQILSLLVALHKDRERQEREHKKALESMHRDNMAMFRQCLDILKDVKESFKHVHNRPIPSQNFQDSENVSSQVILVSPHDTLDEGHGAEGLSSNGGGEILIKSEDSDINSQKHCCEVCGKTFARAIGLKRHKRVHFEKKSNSREKHDMNVRPLGQTHEHKKIPSLNLSHICEVCGKGFYNKCILDRHKRTHTGHRPHACKVCGKTFARTDDLKVHHIVHETGWFCQCDICGKGFKHKLYLQRHMLTHLENRPYKNWCEVCGKGFSSSAHLREHFVTHTGEKPFICEMCGKGCSSKTALKRHKFSHSNEKPCKCHICGKGFITNTHVKRHRMLKHPDCKPYVCDLCNSAFDSLHDLQKHSRFHVPEQC